MFIIFKIFDKNFEFYLNNLPFFMMTNYLN